MIPLFLWDIFVTLDPDPQTQLHPDLIWIRNTFYLLCIMGSEYS